MVALWTSQVLSIMGGHFIELGIPWLLLATHHNADSTVIMAIIPLVTAATALPIGRWVAIKHFSTFPSKAEMAQGTVFLALGILMMVGTLHRFVVVALVSSLILIGTFSTVMRITITPLVRSIFGPHSMVRVVNYLEGADAIATIVAPILAGTIFTLWGGRAILGTLAVMFWGAGFGLAVLGRHHTNIAIPSFVKKSLI